MISQLSVLAQVSLFADNHLIIFFNICLQSYLLISLQVDFELRRLADKKGPDEEDFNKLAASLEELISRLFDPLKSGGRIRDVFLRSSIDDVMEAAIEFEQKKASRKYVFPLTEYGKTPLIRPASSREKLVLITGWDYVMIPNLFL